MLVPRYWAKSGGSAAGPDGERYQFQLWGWSQDSAAEALARARERWEALAARIRRGEAPGSYPYAAQPLREELIRWIGPSGDVAFTRNRYGALVLNTARVPFIDIDAPPVGLWSRLWQRWRGQPAVDPTLENIREACARDGRHSFRIYKTLSGYRVLATDLLLDPKDAGTAERMAAFGADPHFVTLCRRQDSFRARLTPKPWRCGCGLPPGSFPRDDADGQRQFAAWLARYEAAAERYASCRFLERQGPGRTLPEAQPIVDEHDHTTRALADLPLA